MFLFADSFQIRYSDYRERNMPSSPLEVKTAGMCSPQGQASPGRNQGNQQRPLSGDSSNYPGLVNGLPSPTRSSQNGSPGDDPALSPPPPLGGNNMAQQLPPACGARQLSKLKRFLTTLIQFGSDISSDIGDRVRSLILALVNNHLSVEEFHSKLQEATNFPLRPFVIPFLKANLPLLQRELLYCARLARQTPQQYLANHDHLLFDPTHVPMALHNSPPSPPTSLRCQPQDLSTHSALNQNGKRPKMSPHYPKENESTSSQTNPPPAKRPHSSSVSPKSESSPTSLSSPLGLGTALRLDVSMQRPLPCDTDRSSSNSSSDRFFSPYIFGRHSESGEARMDRMEEEWKHLENMLHCIMDMVGRCRQALATVQERVRHERDELAHWIRLSGADPDIKKKADYMTESLRNTEDRVTDMRRRAVHVFPEEAVNEVKRQALLELQKAVATAELKASELVAAERVKMEQAIDDAQRQAKVEIEKVLNQQVESSETCWNCGRKASETCSGCNVARYCGSFCQHKDWERHHKACRQQGNRATSPAALSSMAAITTETGSGRGNAMTTIANSKVDGNSVGHNSLSSLHPPREVKQETDVEPASPKALCSHGDQSGSPSNQAAVQQ